MDLITPIEAAEVDREIYVALVKSCTRAKGAKAELARRAKITPQYLSFLLATEAPLQGEPRTRRQSDIETARRLSDALLLPREKCQEVFRYMVSARRTEPRAKRAAANEPDDPLGTLHELADSARQASREADPNKVQGLYQEVVSRGCELWDHWAVRAWPLEYVNLSLCLHEALCVLDNPAQSLKCARYAEVVLGWIDPARYRGNQELGQNLEANVIRMVARTYEHLGLPKEAGHSLRLMEQTEAVRRRPGDWTALICLDKLGVLLRQSSIRMCEAEKLAARALN